MSIASKIVTVTHVFKKAQWHAMTQVFGRLEANVAGTLGDAGDSGQTAQKISNASFATLSLIYSLTEVLDLSDSLSTLAGLTARVSGMQEVRTPSYSEALKGLWFHA